MPSRPDLRDIASNVKDAFADADRETLLDILTFVIKEYVVEGPPPMLIHQAETLADLKGASFAQLISAMQTRFDHAELAMFVVDGEHVSVRVGGVVQPLLASRQPQDTAAELPRPQAGVRVVEATLQPRPQPAPAPASGGDAPARTAPPPARGISLRGQPTGAGGGGAFGADGSPPAASPASGGQGAPRPAGPVKPPAASSGVPQPAPAAPSAPDKDGTGGDDASARFSLLELD